MKSKFAMALLLAWSLSTFGSGFTVKNGAGLSEFMLASWWNTLPARLSACRPLGQCGLPQNALTALDRLRTASTSLRVAVVPRREVDQARAFYRGLSVVAVQNPPTLLIAQESLYGVGGIRLPIEPVQTEMLLASLRLLGVGGEADTWAMILTATLRQPPAAFSLKAYGYDAVGLTTWEGRLFWVDSSKALDLSSLPALQGLCPQGSPWLRLDAGREMSLQGSGNAAVWDVELALSVQCPSRRGVGSFRLRLHTLLGVEGGSFGDLVRGRPFLRLKVDQFEANRL